MSHTQDKWTVEENGDMYIVSMVNGYKRYVCRIGTTNSTTNGENLANAKRICLTHNCHDFLLESAKNLVRAHLAGESVFIEIGFMEEASSQAETE